MIYGFMFHLDFQFFFYVSFVISQAYS